MLAKFLGLLGLSGKVNAVGKELDAIRDTLRETNERLRDEIGLDVRTKQPKALVGEPRS